jgi:hypothetical protein
MTCWGTHMYRWFCYTCKQQLLSTGQGDVWKCPTCTYLDSSKGDNEAHWIFGVCEHCENIGPADLDCATCMINQGNMVLPGIKEGPHHLQGGTHPVHQERIRNLGELLSLFGRTVLRGGHLEQIEVDGVL